MSAKPCQFVIAATVAFLLIFTIDGSADEVPSGQRIEETLSDLQGSPEFNRVLRKARNAEANGPIFRLREGRSGGDGSEPVTLKKPDLPNWPSFDGPDMDLPFGAFGAFIRIMLFGVATAVVGLVIVLIARSILARKPAEILAVDDAARIAREERVAATTAPGERQPAEYLAAAKRYAAEGRYDESVRQLLLGCMSWMEINKLIRFRKGLTNFDYIRALRGRPDSRAAMKRIGAAFDQVFYGRRTATADAFELCLDAFERGFNGRQAEKKLES